MALRPLLPKFLKRISPEPNTGCWLWVGSYCSEGYGLIWRGARALRAHRISHEHFKGPCGDLMVRHTCDVRCCVNPDHLLLGTAKDNFDDMVQRGNPHPAFLGIGRHLFR
jgi:hypothetical protein